jgi:hypothetical protein
MLRAAPGGFTERHSDGLAGMTIAILPSAAAGPGRNFTVPREDRASHTRPSVDRQLYLQFLVKQYVVALFRVEPVPHEHRAYRLASAG